MKQRSKLRGVFFKRALSLTLAISLIISNYAVSGVLAQTVSQDTEPAVTSTPIISDESTEPSTQTPTQPLYAENTDAIADEGVSATESGTAADTNPTATSESIPTTASDTIAAPDGTTTDPAVTMPPADVSGELTDVSVTEVPGDVTDTPITDDSGEVTDSIFTDEPADITDVEEPSADGAADSTDETLASDGAEITDPVNGTVIDFSTYQTYPLYIYSNLDYSNASNVSTKSSGKYYITGTNNFNSIIVGNQAGYPTSPDIPITISGLNMRGELQINPIGEGSKVILTAAESHIGSITVADGANLVLNLNGTLNVDFISLGVGSTLTIMGGGMLNVIGVFTSKGSISINGGTINANAGISAVSLSLSRANVSATTSCSITASEMLSMESSTVANAALFGFDNSASGPRTLILSGNNIINHVERVGCSENCNARVTVSGIDTVLSHSGNIAYYCDYTIVYQSLDDDTFEPEGDCASTYRVESHIGGTGSKICGYHTDSGFKQAAFVALPEYTKDGYNYMGWRIADGGEAVKELTTQSGNLFLTPVMEPMDVTIKLDLGFDPDIYNSDQDESGNLPQRTSEVKAKVDEEPCFQRLSDSDISLTAGKSAILISCPCLWKVRAQAIQFCMETATWWKMAVSALIW